MSDGPLPACTALAPAVRIGRFGELAGEPGVTMREVAAFGMVSVTARKDRAAPLAETVNAAFGIHLPATPRREAAGDLAFIWSGPNRWLAVAQRQSTQDLAERLAASLAGLASLAEQGDGRALFHIAGPRARDTLAKILTIDLHPRAFRIGDTAVTGAAHLEIQIWQIDESPTYEIALFRGFARSFWDWLTRSAAEYGFRVVAE